MMTKLEKTACAARRDEAGMALLIAVILLLFIGALGLTALQQAEDESSASGQGRRLDAAFYAAEAGLNYAETEVRKKLDADQDSELSINESSFVSDGFDNAIKVQSGPPGSYVPIGKCASESNPVEGYELREGGAKLNFCRMDFDIVATDVRGSQVHLSAGYKAYQGAKVH